MRVTKDYCDHCGKELDYMNDYGDTEITVLTSFLADLCAECIESLDEIALKFCKKGGADDVAEVVRCKDCIHARNMPLGLCYLHTEPYDNAKGYKGDAVCVEPNDFCSYGKQKMKGGA